ncbi:calmodulin-like [Haliotis cracherodii]|uniref:calmodulin-like n=1 Tax=Haliotis cracherodii TaxID=6455 RepID=UPI0039EA98E4
MPDLRLVFLLLGSAAVHGLAHNLRQQGCIQTSLNFSPYLAVRNIINDMDKNGDGTLEQSEVVSEFVTRYDSDNNSEISEAEFVIQWILRYHDGRDFAIYLFHHFDKNDDLKLTSADFLGLQAEIDSNGDGKLSNAEFQTFMLDIYKNCVPGS